MPRKALIPALIMVLVLGVAAYRLFVPSTMSEAGPAPINSYLKGEMAKLSLPDKHKVLSDDIVMREDGSPVKLSEIRGKALLVNLWASWCAPCRAEMKELANLQKLLGDDTFEVMAITVDRGGIAQARETLAEWGIEGLGLYADPTMTVALTLAGGKLPTSYIVAPDGKVKAYYLGPLKWDSDEAIELFTALKEGRL